MNQHSGRRLIVIDSAPVRRGQYWAVGYGGLAGRADFRLAGFEPTLERWHSFGISVSPWHDRPSGQVVLCGQLPHDANVQDTDHLAWCKTTFKLLNNDWGWSIAFRPHPRIADPSEYGILPVYWDRRPLEVMFRNTRCVVTWNSTIGTDAAIAGVPVIALDEGSFAYPIASHTASVLRSKDRLPMPSREPWLAGLAYCQWNLAEMRSGEAWAHLGRPWSALAA